MTLMKSGPDYEYDEPQMRKKTIETLWHEFSDVCIDDNDRIDSSWCGWEFGTDRFEIWHWFDAQYAKWGGVHALMFPEERKNPTSKHGSVTAVFIPQVWVNDYAMDIGEKRFDCGAALDKLPLDYLRDLSNGIEDGDNVYYAAEEIGLLDAHHGPFYVVVEDDELYEYILKREKEEA